MPGLLTAPAVIGSFLLGGLPLVVAAFALGVSIGFIPLLFVIPMELANLRRNIAGATGVISSVGSMGSMIMATAVGFVKDLTGNFTGALLPLLPLALAIPILALAVRKKESDSEMSKEPLIVN